MDTEPKGVTTKYIVGLIVVAFIIIGVSFVGGKRSAPEKADVDAQEAAENAQSAEAMKKQAAVEIDYTYENGFTPDHVTIKSGATVKFVNNSSSEMWVASNPHPFHTDYPGFDENQSVLKGGIYQFTFTKMGNWGFHNHRRPKIGGVINVK